MMKFRKFSRKSFPYNEPGECRVGDQLAGRSELRVVHVVRDVGGEEPVIRAVLEEVPQGHRCVREAVHENRLQQPLHVVDRVTCCSDAGKEGKKEENKIKILFIKICLQSQ